MFTIKGSENSFWQVEWTEHDASPAFCLCIDNCTDVMDDDMLPWCLYVYNKRLFHILKNKITKNNFCCHMSSFLILNH